MSLRSGAPRTLLPDGRRLLVDAVTAVLAVLLAALVLVAFLGSGGGATRYAALVALNVVPAQVVQAALGQLLLVRIRSLLLRSLAMLGVWTVVLFGLSVVLPLLPPVASAGSAFLLVLPEVALLAVVRGSVIGVLDLDRRDPRPAAALAGPSEQPEV